MGRASGCNAGGENAIARELVLKVAMHCRCDGCTPKVRSAVMNLALAPGVLQVLGRSATEATEEVRLIATADPERLRRRLHKATGKKEVGLVLIPPRKTSDGGSSHKKGPRLVDAAAVQAPLADPQLEALLAHLQRHALLADLQPQAPLRGHRDQYVDHGAAAALPGDYQQQQPNLDWDSYGEASYPWVPPHWPAPAAAPALDWGANYGPAWAPPGNCDPSAPPWHSGLGF